MKRILISSTAVIALVGCEGTIDTTVLRSYSEAGGIIDNGNFGNAVANNIQYQNGEKNFAIDLSNRFARQVPNTVNFAFNSAKLDGAAQSALARQANFIRQYPEVRFRVYGHTDAVGSDSYNRSLGQRRANAVVNYLVSRGISRSRLEAVVSFGESQPLVVTQGRERRNRRTVTEVSGFVESHPLILDGKYAEVIHREYIDSAVPPQAVTEISVGDEL